jgi:15-cis-phytoene synthase
MAGEIRLQWWRDALERPGSGEAKANPVAAALLDTIIRFRLPVERLIALVEARAFDLYNDPMPTLAALEAYASHTSSALIELAARILGGDRIDASDAARHAGVAYAIAGLLRAFPLHAARGRLFIPLELLERHGAKAEDVLAGRATPALSAALTELRQAARGHFQAYRDSAGAIPARVAPS